MPEFCTPIIEDKEKVDKILFNSDFEGSFYSFAAIYSWASLYQTKIAIVGDALLISGVSEKYGMYFLYPVGEFDLSEMIDVMRREARDNGSDLKIIAEKRQAEKLYTLFGDSFDIEDARDEWDYVYLADDLASLRGNKYHSKRNHISKLIKRFQNSEFTFEMISKHNIDECLAIEKAWVSEKEDDSDFDSVTILLDNMKNLGLSGGLLRIDGKAIAFTVGERLLDDTFIIHIEKSLSGYDGAYQMINQMFAKTLTDKYIYINREEDMGIEGLRKSKFSYFPCKMIEKCVITERK